MFGGFRRRVGSILKMSSLLDFYIAIIRCNLANYVCLWTDGRSRQRTSKGGLMSQLISFSCSTTCMIIDSRYASNGFNVSVYKLSLQGYNGSNMCFKQRHSTPIVELQDNFFEELTSATTDVLGRKGQNYPDVSSYCTSIFGASHVFEFRLWIFLRISVSPQVFSSTLGDKCCGI